MKLKTGRDERCAAKYARKKGNAEMWGRFYSLYIAVVTKKVKDKKHWSSSSTLAGVYKESVRSIVNVSG